MAPVAAHHTPLTTTRYLNLSKPLAQEAPEE